MTDKELIRELLAFSEQLITEHRLGEALVVSVAAARLMELPERVEVLRHPSGKVADTTTVRPGTIVPFKKNLEG